MNKTLTLDQLAGIEPIGPPMIEGQLSVEQQEWLLRNSDYLASERASDEFASLYHERLAPVLAKRLDDKMSEKRNVFLRHTIPGDRVYPAARQRSKPIPTLFSKDGRLRFDIWFGEYDPLHCRYSSGFTQEQVVWLYQNMTRRTAAKLRKHL